MGRDPIELREKLLNAEGESKYVKRSKLKIMKF